MRGVTLLGLGLIGAAVALLRKAKNDFIVQGSRAASLAGQAMFGWGIADLAGGNDETVCAMMIAISAVLFFAFPDRIHRVLSVLWRAARTIPIPRATTGSAATRLSLTPPIVQRRALAVALAFHPIRTGSSRSWWTIRRSRSNARSSSGSQGVGPGAFASIGSTVPSASAVARAAR